MTTKTTTKFTREFRNNANGSHHVLIAKSPGYADLVIAGINGNRDRRTGRLLPGEADTFGVYRDGDTDLIAEFRTQREARAYVTEAIAIDAQG